MIRALSELGKVLRSELADNEWSHDALKQEMISMVLTINDDGSFVSLKAIENKKTIAEAVQRSRNKQARFLLDNCGYVLGVYDPENNNFKNKIKEKGEQKAHEIFKEDVAVKQALFVERINNVSLACTEPVRKFYSENKQAGIDVIEQQLFLETIPKSDRGGNIAFLLLGDNEYVHEKDVVYNQLIAFFEKEQKNTTSKGKKSCAVCGKNDSPVEDIPHFPIKQLVGDKEPAGGRKLVSYNENAFESYGLKGNLNASICTNCAKTYVEGLNWLLSAGNERVVEDKKGKEKTQFRYSNRKNFGSDTAMVFWTRNNQKIEAIEQLNNPDPGEVRKMIDSLASGAMSDSRYIETEQFYSCTLSGAAARIAVRDWIETSLGDFKMSIANWFNDIAIGRYDRNHEKIQTVYVPIYALARSCQRQRQKNDGNYEYDKDDSSTARVAAALWNAALKNSSIPLWILTKILARARLSKNGVSEERAALIKIILNRNNMGGGFMITENMAMGERPVAYVCGQIFAKLERIQYAALGKEVNAGIREKYFTYALTSPASAFGRLFNLSSKHFTKLKSEKPGLAVNLDKELQALCKDVNIQGFPLFFQLEEQGQFAIGYYHQKQSQFANYSNQQGGNNDE